MKNKFLLWFWILFPLLAFSQGENDNWYFGDKAAVNFSGTTPLVLNNSVMNTLEAVGAVSDSNGNLLFYTDGVTIWNRQHQIMQNGTGLSGNLSSQQLIIVKDPANTRRYYVFTTALTLPSSSNIAYSIVDMSLGAVGTNGQNLGGVISTSKNIPILDNTGSIFQTEAITAIPHADGSSFWILIPNNMNLYTYLLDINGFNTSPVISSLGGLFLSDYFSIKPSPKLSISSNYSHFISINRWNSSLGNTVFSFDNATGTITNDYLLDITTMSPYSAEFNEDASVLYLSSRVHAQIYAIDIVNSQSSVISRLVYSNSGLNASEIQRNTDNEIYLNIENYNYLAKIDNPNSYSLSSVNINSIYLNGKNTRMGLPQLIPLHTGCVSDILLTTPETNNNYVYHAGNTITTQTNYSINNKNIIMKAGESINLLPGTDIVSDNYVAIIEDCIAAKPSRESQSKTQVKLFYTLDDKAESVDNSINIYPNPTSDVLNISSKNGLEMKEIEITDLSGRIVRTLNNATTINVSDLSAGTYLIDITTNEGKASSKFVKK